MIRLPLVLVAVLLLTWETSSALAVAKPASRDDVLQSIAVFQKDPASKEGFAAAETIMAFAKESKSVHLSLSKAVVPWMKTEEVSDADTRGILLTAYLAGNIQSQLKSNKAQDDVYAGWQEVLAIYAHLLSINSAAKISEVDDLKKKEANGSLRAYALEVQKP